MVDTASVAGGAKSVLASLSPAEHHAATQALARLESLDRGGVSSFLGGSATLSGGTAHALDTTVVGSGKLGLISGVGSDTFVGGVSSAAHATGLGGTEAVTAGSAGLFASHLTNAESLAHSGAGLSLSNDTIKAAGVTAASVKADKPSAAHAAGTTVTMADKTTVNLIGVSAHKPN